MPVDLSRLPALLTRLPHLEAALSRTRRKITSARAARAFWPLASVSLTALGAAQLPLPEWALSLGFAIGSTAFLASLAWGLARFSRAQQGEAVAALDAELAHRPLAALLDTPSTTGEIPTALWHAHLARAEAALSTAQAPRIPWKLAQYDRFGLRYMALMFAASALLFSAAPPNTTHFAPQPSSENAPVFAQSAWEGWITPPAFTGQPVIYLPEQPEGPIDLPQGSTVSLRFYGDEGAFTLFETVSGTEPAVGSLVQFEIVQEGSLEIIGATNAEWTIGVLPDFAPEIRFEGAQKTESTGAFSWPFLAQDDYGLRSARVTITLDLEKIDRRFGLAASPSLSEPILRELPLPFARQRTEIKGTFSENFSEHPFAGLPVIISLEATDVAGQVGTSPPVHITLPGKRFFQPTAKAVAELRRDLVWSQDNSPKVTQLLSALLYRPEELLTNRLAAQRLSHVRRQLSRSLPEGPSPDLTQDLASQMWKVAIQLEEGTLADARARLERAKERLAEAMRSGASPEEIQELMDELRAATEAYLDLLASEATPGESTLDQPSQGQSENRTITQDQIQALMDRIQELMQEGRMAEAAELMAQLSALLENLQMQQSEGGEGRQGGPDQELQDNLREQQDLADDAFRELQEEFSRNRQAQSGLGDSASPQGQGGQEGQSGGQGQEGQNGAQAPDVSGGQGTGQGEDGSGNSAEPSLAERQNALRQSLEALQDSLPEALSGLTMDAARDALGRAQSAMDEAEQNLADRNLSQALQNQAEALEALREGLSQLRRAMSEAEQSDGAEDQGNGQAQSASPDALDPLGRSMGQGAPGDSGDSILPEGLPQRDAEDLRQELRRRAGERERSETELDYLRRLLESY